MFQLILTLTFLAPQLLILHTIPITMEYSQLALAWAINHGRQRTWPKFSLAFVYKLCRLQVRIVHVHMSLSCTKANR